MSVFSGLSRSKAEDFPLEEGSSSDNSARLIEQIRLFTTAREDTFDRSTFDAPQKTERLPEYIKSNIYMPPVYPTEQPDPRPRVDLKERLKDAPETAFSESVLPEPQQIQETLTESEIAPVTIEAPRFGFNAIKKVMPAIRRTRKSVSAAREQVSNSFALANVYLGKVNTANLAAKAQELRNNPNTKKKMAIVAAGVGVLALGAAGMYLTHKGVTHPVPAAGGTHESAATAVQNLQPKMPAHPEHPVHKAVGTALAVSLHKTTEAYNRFINIKQGQGYTQAIKEYFPGKSASQYLSAYKEAIKTLGPNFIKGAHHYKMTDGSYGLNAGDRAHLTKSAYRLLSTILKSHQ
jgi:hypothetical protein